jgi:hypothetical protein
VAKNGQQPSEKPTSIDGRLEQAFPDSGKLNFNVKMSLTGCWPQCSLSPDKAFNFPQFTIQAAHILWHSWNNM